MPESPPEEKELRVPDPNVAAISTTNEERHDAADGPGDYGVAVDAKDVDEIEAFDKDSVNDEESMDEKRQALNLTKSAATDVSSLRDTTAEDLVKKSRWNKINPLRWGKVPPIPDEKITSKEYKAGFFSLLTFQWMSSLMTTGYKRELHERDLWAVNPDRSVDVLTAKVKDNFKFRIGRGDKNPLVWALHDSFRFEFWLGGMCALLGAILQVMGPFTLRYLIQFATDAYVAKQAGTSAPPIKNGIGLAIGITAMQVVQTMCINHFIYRGMTIGGQSRGVLIGMIYEKAMVISGRAKAGRSKDGETDSQDEKPSDDSPKTAKKATKGRLGEDAAGPGSGWSNGRIVNLMSVDTYRIDQASALFHMIWTGPISCVITLVVLLINLTYSALAGFGLLLVGVPLLTIAMRHLFIRRKAINKITDQRVSLTQEIIQSVRFVKFFGWESAFLSRLAEYRKREISSIQVLLATRNAVNAISMSLPIFASMLTFITYSLTSHALDPAKIFSSLALFNGLRMPLNLLPLVLGNTIDAWSSLQRIEEFLREEEMAEDSAYEPHGEHAIDVFDASFTWEKTSKQDPDKGTISASDDKSGSGNMSTSDDRGKGAKEEKEGEGFSAKKEGEDSASTLVEDREPFKLQNLNLQVGRSELIAVIGGVGSGKSSLLAALAGDMRRTEGELTFGASRAFCPQYAWIQNTTLQKNILFGKEMDKSWYNQVIKACALQPDIDMLPHGDLTEIGERGITISGGQKQRLNIARAIYFDSDIVLMDDPLSAVDAHVGRHIFDNAILGLLKNKTRVLATHQLWVLNRCDRIVWMENGKIQAVDTFDKLMAEHKGFQALMETTAVNSEEEGEDGVADVKKEAKPEDRKKKKKAAALMQQEERAVSSVPWSVYKAYIKSSGSILNAPLVVGLLVVSQGANIITSLWLSYWTSDKYHLSTGTYIGVYAGLGAVQALLVFLFSVTLTVLGTNASRVMLREAITRVLRAPMSFFDTTPLGRITNRFSRDVDVMDNNLTDAIRMYFFTIVMITSIFGLIIAYFHYFAIALGPLYVLFFLAAAYYRASAREVKRYESVLRSNVFAKFSEGLNGVASIRAYGLKRRFIEELREHLDVMNGAYFITFANQRWLSVRLDSIGNILVFITAILVVTSRFNVDPSIGGLVLSYILSIVQMLQFGVRQLAEVENGMNAVERLRHYGSELEEEAPLHTVPVRPSWPEKGEIVFDNVQMRYRDGLPLVLNGLSMHVRGGERIGIVGRTGAGKSSIMSTLFRLVELSGGSITVDGLNISTIGLHDLRSRLAIIPQDPTLFRGTIRSNIDPFNEHSDAALWAALRQADLVPAHPTGGAVSEEREAASASDAAAAAAETSVKADTPRISLDSVVEEDGLNFSLGQRQLMALARALVRGAQIIVCDEATSSVDMETDDKIQSTIATGFKGKTLLCIAHRLRTIVGYDRICVMDAGGIAELDTPLELWKREKGIFRGMCESSGIRVEDIKGAREEMLALTGDVKGM